MFTSMYDTSINSTPRWYRSYFSVLRKKASWAGVAILLLFLLLECLYSAWTLGQTIDETFYNGSGYPIVRYNNYEFLGEHPPLIIQLGALPLLFLQPNFPIQNFVRLPVSNLPDITKCGVQFLYQMGNNPQLILFLERLFVIFLTVSLGFGIFRWGRDIYGEWGAILALGLYVCTPDIIGNGSLYMTDMGLTVFYFFSIYALKRFFDEPSARLAMISGIAIGLAFMSKISSLILIPIVSCLFLVYHFSQRNEHLMPEPSAHFQKIIFTLAFFLLVNAIGEKMAMVLFGPFLLLALYLFGRDMPCLATSRPLRILFQTLILGGAILCAWFAWQLKTKYGVSITLFILAGIFIFTGFSLFAARWPSFDNRIRLVKYFLAAWVFAAFVIVLGYTDIVYKFHRLAAFANYMKPLKIVINHLGEGHGSYVPGSFITSDWRYFPFVMAVKTPLLVLFLSGIGTLLFLGSRQSILIKTMIILPVAFFLGTAMANKINIGLRHILPVYPFIFLLGGFPVACLARIRFGSLKVILVTMLSVFFTLFVMRTLKTAPDHLVYYNEAVGDAEQGSKLISSNWGQDDKALAEFVLKKKILFIKIASEVSNPDIYDYYKISWNVMNEDEMAAPRPGFYALGIGIYLTQQNDSQSWFKGKQPLYRVGKTFYIFKVP